LFLFPNLNGTHWSVLWEGNWKFFVGGGATVGTPDLLGQRHVTWELAHGFLIAWPWNYPPAVAWFYAPFAHVPLWLGFWFNAIVMLGACVASGIIAARVYGLTIGFSIFAVLAWEPAVASISLAESASLALLLYMICILGLVRGQSIVTGIAVGLLLFKPTDAAVFILLLLLRREWRALVVVAVACLGWYLAGVPATAGDWAWPHHYATFLYAYYPHQALAERMIGTSALATRLGAPALLANAICAALLLAWCIIVIRVTMIEAASFAGLLAIAISPHAFSYEAALLVPSLFYIMTKVREPWRTRIIAIAYVTGGISILWLVINFDPLALLVSLGALCYLAVRLMYPSSEAWPLMIGDSPKL
jgi:Glycosyltransferase family 87